MATKEPEKTTLGGFIEQLYKNWGQARKKKEIHWQEDLDNFMAEEDWKGVTTSRKTWKSRDTRKQKQEDQWKSEVFVRLVKQKVVMAYTFLNDLVLQGGKIPFMLKANTATYAPEEEETAQAQADEMADIIRDQLVEAKADRTFMKGTFSMALYGECVVKSPLFHEIEKKRWARSYPPGFEGNQEYAMFEKETWVEAKPALDYKSVWNIFVDPEYTDIQKSRGIIERDQICSYDLRQLQGRPGYDDEAIDMVIAEDVARTRVTEDTATLPPHLRDIPNPNRTIEYIEFWGRVPIRYLTDFAVDNKQFDEVAASRFDLELPQIDDPERIGEDIEVQVIMANDTIIRIMLNDQGKRPYHLCKFEEILDEPHGIGTARNLIDAQLITNGAYRNAIDNIALSGNVIIGTDDDALVPGQSKKVWPGKNFRFVGGTDVRKAMGSIRIQNVAGDLLELLALAKQHADEESQIPRIMQGDTAPKKKPDTLGEINLLYQNAGKYMGQVVKNLDEELIEPVLEEFYDYNMMIDSNQAIKGDFAVHALGFNSFQSKVVKSNALKDFLQLLLLHETLMSEADIRPILEEIGKAMDLDPDQFLLTAEEKQKMQELQAQAAEEQFQRELALVREQRMVEVEAKDMEGDNQLERDMALEEQKAKLEEKKASSDTERKVIERAAESKFKIQEEKAKPKPTNGTNGASAKPKPREKTTTKAKGGTNGKREPRKRTGLAERKQ